MSHTDLERVYVYMPFTLVEQLDDYKDQSFQSRSSVVRAAVARYLREQGFEPKPEPEYG